MSNEEVKRRIGVCPECKVRNDDSSEKDLYECRIVEDCFVVII